MVFVRIDCSTEPGPFPVAELHIRRTARLSDDRHEYSYDVQLVDGGRMVSAVLDGFDRRDGVLRLVARAIEVLT